MPVHLQSRLRIYIGLLFTAASVFTAEGQQRTVTSKDCIEMFRIQQTYDPNDPTVVFSSDGRQFVTMIWRGNLNTNLNDYTVLLFDAQRLDQQPTELLNVSFAYEQKDQQARPMKGFAFLEGNRLASLATFHGEPRQVVAIDLKTRAVIPLTKHPEGVLAFAVTSTGKIVYAAYGPPNETKKAALYRDGFSLEDRDAISSLPMAAIAAGDWFSPKIEYFFLSSPGTSPRKIYEDVEAFTSRPNFWMSPDDRHAVVYPYVATAGEKPTIGLIDMTTGTIEPLLQHGQHGDSFSDLRWVKWAHNSRSLLVFTAPYGAPNVLSEISLSTRRPNSVRVGQDEEWNPLGWTMSDAGVIFTRGPYAKDGDSNRTLATLRRSINGWEGLNALARADSKFELNSRYYPGTNGHLIVGVKDDLSEPPELAAYDLETKRTIVLTHLNPQLRDLKLGDVTRIQWSGLYDKGTSFGYLIKPVGYVAGKKYPLIIQLKDEGYFPEDKSFILDGTEQLSGAAIQVWANNGFMVLFTPWPLSATSVRETPKEDEYMTAHIESGLDMLESSGEFQKAVGWSVPMGEHSRTVAEAGHRLQVRQGTNATPH